MSASCTKTIADRKKDVLYICSCKNKTTYVYDPVKKKVVKKNGTLHSKFQLGNLTKISEFNDRNFYFFIFLNDIEKITKTKPVK